MKIAILLACHNRKNETIKTLQSFLTLDRSDADLLKFFVVDDGSTDGTADAVRNLVPDATILRGDGSLYWTRSMRWAMKRAYRERFDFYWCVNDDTVLERNALNELLESASRATRVDVRWTDRIPAVIVSGATRDARTGKTSYGGSRRSTNWHPLRMDKIDPDGTTRPCDAINMNATLISGAVLDRIGVITRAFRQGGGDYDYGYRAIRGDIPVVLSRKYVGYCDANPIQGGVHGTGGNVFSRFRQLLSVKFQPPWERAVYYRRYGGAFWPLFWIAPYLGFWFHELRFSLRNILGRG